MKLYKYLIIFFLFFQNFSFSHDSSMVFVDVEKIIYSSNAGKIFFKNLDSEIKKQSLIFNEKEEKFKNDENEILKKKNILSDIELNKKLNDLKNEIVIHNSSKQDFRDKINKKRQNGVNKIINNLNEIIFNYAKENSISMIIQKKNIIIGKSDLDVTNEILKTFNENFKNLN